VDGAGNLYATAPTSHSVLKFSPTGTLLGQKSAQGDATLQLPTGLTVDAQGTVYVVDTTASRVVNLGTIP
jgi:sugar lactone lactonase YvrE